MEKKKNYKFVQNIFLTTFFAMTTVVMVNAQNASITVSTGNTANGSWSGGTAGPYVFTPSANGATIVNTDIVNRLTGAGGYTQGNVTIQTACSSCSEVGDITISNAITAANTGTIVPTLSFNAQNNININANINLTGATGTTGATGAAFPPAVGGTGGVGGYAINLSFATNTLQSSITMNNSNSVTIVSTGGTGGAGGTGSRGQNGGVGGVGGQGGTITFNSAGSVNIGANNSLTSNGGSGGSGGSGGAAGGGGGSTAGATGANSNAGNVFIQGVNGITLAGNLTATGVANGNFTINDGNKTVTTGGGVNDGQTAGVILGGNLTKLGNGTFYISGTNTYTGTTTITNGTLRSGGSGSITASANGPFGNNASGIYLNGGTIEDAISGTFSRPLTVSATGSRIDAYGAARTISSTITLATAGSYTLNIGGTTASNAEGQSLTLSGVIGNSSGTLQVIKTGTSTLTLSAANTYTGGTELSSGTLNINNASALGNVSDTFTIDSLTTIDNTTGGAITTSNYPQVWNGNFNFTGTNALNLGTGSVTMNYDVQIKTVASTLTVGGVLNNPLRSLTKLGSGTFAFSSQAITLNALTISAGTLTSTSGNMSVGGNFYNNSTFTHNNGTVTLNGSALQIVGGGVVTNFYNLTANNTYTTSPQIVLANTESVSATFTMNNGNIDARTNSKTLAVSNNATGAISRTNGYVIGNLQRAITNTGSPTYLYPLGTSTGYTPASIVFNTLSTAGNIIGSAKEGDYSNICSSKINQGTTVNDYWTFSNNGVAFTNYGIAFNYPSLDIDAGAIPSGFVAGNYSGSAWSYPTIGGTPSTTTLTFTGATAFGSYAIGDTVTNSISYSLSVACNNSSTVLLPTIKGAKGGKYTSAQGLAIDSLSGNISPNASNVGTYTVTYTPPAGVCAVTARTTTVTIKASPNAGITNTTGTTLITCKTPTINVTATGGATYTWSGGNNTASSANSFTTSGVYTVSVTSNGCSTEDSIKITKDVSTPTISITNNTGNDTLTCVRKSISVTASGGNTYSWTGGSSTATAANTFVSAGTYSVTATDTVNGCSSVATKTIKIDTIPPSIVITNNTGTTILTCSTASIHVTASGGSTYSWSGGSSTSTASNSFNLLGTYTVNVTKNNTGCSASKTITITQDTTSTQIANTTGSTVLNCYHPSIYLIATGGSSYSWSGGTSTATAADTIVASGTYTVTSTNTNGCNNKATITITQNNSVPTAGITNNTGSTQLDCINTLIHVTATGGNVYNWTGGSSNATDVNTFNSPGTYSVTVSDSVNGCSSLANIAITKDVSTPTVSIANNTGNDTLTCARKSINVTASGGSTYSWTGGSSASAATNSFDTPGKYKVNVSGSNGCSTIDSVIINQDTAYVGIINNTGTTVLNCSVSTISVTAVGGKAYKWTGGSSIHTASNTFNVAGIYTVTVTNNNGCDSIASINITQDVSTPTVSITNNAGTTQLDCNYGSINVTASGGNFYNWSGGSTPNVPSNTFTSPATYSVTVIGSNGCSAMDSVVITQNTTTPAASITNNTGTTVLTCSTKTINVTASGGSSYFWTGGSSNLTASNSFISTGKYFVTVTGSNGCTSQDSITFTQDTTTTSILNNSGITEINCINTFIGVQAFGGSAYSWSGGTSPATAVNTFTTAGTYSVTVTNSNGCNNKAAITITQNTTPPTVSINNNSGSTQLDCNNSSISVKASGGTSYSWTGGNTPTTDANTFTTADTYSVTVTGNNGCTTVDSIVITEDKAPPVVLITNQTGSAVLTCSRAYIDVIASGGNLYSWTGGKTPATAANTFSVNGTYKVNVIGNNGCVAVDSIAITIDTATAKIVNTSGSSQLDCIHSSINVYATGGSSYAWSGGATPTSANNTFTSPGSYSVTATNTNGCKNKTSIIITKNVSTPIVTITNYTGSTQLNCTNYSINVKANGAAAYTWSGGTSTGTAINSFTAPGTYTANVIGSNGCTASKSITITYDTTTPTVTITNNSGGITQLDCAHPVINVTASGANSYVWSGGANVSSAVNSFTSYGNYVVTGSLPNGCSATANIFLTQDNNVPTIGITNNSGFTLLTCNAPLISLTGTGADSYSWSGGTGVSTDTNSVSLGGTYTVTGTLASNGCSATDTITIFQNLAGPGIVIANNTGSTALSCTVSAISVTATGNASSYTWSGGTSTATAANTFSSPGTYIVTGNNSSNGCNSLASITIIQDTAPPALTITNNTGSTQLNCTNSVIRVLATGANIYNWSGGSSTNTAANTFSLPGTYTLSAVGSNGCTNSTSITITKDITTPTVTITNTTASSVLSCANAYVNVTANGASSYIWSGGNSTNTATDSLTSAGTYTVVGIASNGCRSNSTILITQNTTLPTIGITNNSGGSTIICDQHPTIDLTASGGVSYVWSGGISTATASNSFSTPGTYTITVTGTNGCSNYTTVAVSQISVGISLTSGTNPGCAGLAYTFSAYPSNGNEYYQWTINGNNVGTKSTAATFTSSSLQNLDVVGVVMTVSSLSLTASSSLTMTINAAPAKATITQNGNILMSSATTGNQWYLNGVKTPGATSQFDTITQQGFYSVQVSNGICSTTSNSYSSVTGIDQYSLANTISVFPNPFSDQTTVVLSKEVKNATLKLIDIHGATERESIFSGNKVIIEKGNLSGGIYFIQVIADGEAIANLKVIIQ